jgi:hypothetical protein
VHFFHNNSFIYHLRLSYGTGRPAILKADDSIINCRLFLQHPLAVEDDTRLVSTVELMALREHVHNALSPIEQSIREQDFEELQRADINFRNWYSTWNAAFAQKYEDAGSYCVSQTPCSCCLVVIASILSSKSADSKITCPAIPQRDCPSRH